MDIFYFKNILILLSAFQHFGSFTASSVESVIDSLIASLPYYLIESSEESSLQSIGRVVRSCPFRLGVSQENEEIISFVSTCLNITNLVPFVNLHILFKSNYYYQLLLFIFIIH